MGFILGLYGEPRMANKRTEVTENTMDSGIGEFMVGGKPRTLKFTAAARYRLFLNIPQDEIQNYIASENFKLTALSLLLYGKEYVGKTVDEVLERFEEDELMDTEMEIIVGWVRQRTINFMLKEAEEVSKMLEQVMPRATELNNTLIGSQDSISKK